MPARKAAEKLIYMSAGDFNAALESVFSSYPQPQFATISGISRSQVNRYANGLAKIPKYVALILVMAAAMRDAGMTLPEPATHADTAAPGKSTAKRKAKGKRKRSPTAPAPQVAY